jgi:carbamoyl-phosphate synthase small subunit
MKTKLILKNGEVIMGRSFGAPVSATGEVVFATGMVGYPEALTDPSFCGQILVLTSPMVGNYGIPNKENWESKKIQIAGLVVCDYNDTPSHHASMETLSSWVIRFNIPAIEIKDTRHITQVLRESGTMLGKIICGANIAEFEDPNLRNLVKEVSTKETWTEGDGKNTVVVIDCGVKLNIIRQLTKRGLKVVVVPFDTDVTKLTFSYSAVIISNGPGDPKKVGITISNVKKILAKKIPTFGICLGNQILALATGGNTYKLPFGHRSQNQPCVLTGTNKCYLTTQNHGFAIKKVPADFREWFYNANDLTNEGIIHKTLPFMSVQFHPESSPGPLDTDWVFDFFFKKAKINTKK